MGARVVLSHEDAILAEVELTKPVTVVGRHPACDIVIEHPAVSGRHMLFRVVDRTVYAEDLASTNGTRVNGLAVSHQVVHHLDMIEVGKHKIHFFDDSLLAGGVGNLESTVHTDFERTMLASHAAEPAPRAARESDEDLSRTMAIMRPTVRMGPVQEQVSTTATAVREASFGLRVLNGPSAGGVLALTRANTMIGESGTDTALVVRRGAAVLLARFAGAAPRLNGREIGPGSQPLAAGDRIQVGATRYELFMEG